MKKFLIATVPLSLLVLCVLFPACAGAVTGKSLGLFPCNGPDCTFGSAIDLVNSGVKTLFIAILIITPFLIAKAGYHFIIGGNKPAERAKGQNQLMNIVIGLVIIASSYAVVKLVLTTLLDLTKIKTGF